MGHPFDCARRQRSRLCALDQSLFSSCRRGYSTNGLGLRLIAIGTAVNVIRRARAQMRSSRRYFLPWLAIILSLLPYPLSDFMLHNAARTRGFFLEL
jgi:hypothetical protein